MTAAAKPDQLLTRTRIDLDRRPMLVFWETTRACELACRHCRASALAEPLPDELTTEESLAFLETLTGFGRPYPVLILTGGDVLMRPDLLELTTFARGLGLSVALAPSVTPRLTAGPIDELRALGVKLASISLDGAGAGTHERVRQVPGHFEATLAALRLLRSRGLTVQVNTVVMRDTVDELPEVARIVAEAGAGVWEVFFLVRTGRGSELAELTPAENEDVCHFLFDASRYGFVVRTVEGPFFRRIVAQRRADLDGAGPRHGEVGPLYDRLSTRLRELLGPPERAPRAQTMGTRDGRGIVFVAHNGDVQPAGFLPVVLGNVKHASVVDLYRGDPLLRQIRAADFHGRCGACEYAQLCGGSRSRAYATFGDALAEDPGCAYVPATVSASG